MKNKFIFILIIILAIFFRFNNLNWDSNTHLHPDERFLTMVSTAEKIPANLLNYFNPAVSTLNPANIGYKFFVYGTFPLTLNKALAVVFNNDNYNALTIQGRFLSAFFDLLTLILVYKIAQLLFADQKSKIKDLRSNIPLWSAFFYAIAVFPIQLSHFFAVDTFLTFFMIGSFYFALKTTQEKVTSYKLQVTSFLSAIFFGFALACKISAVYILPLNLLILFLGLLKQKKSFLFDVSCFMFYAMCCYFILRLVDPYLFQNTNFFNPLLSENFVKNIKELTIMSSGQVVYPPTIQWYSKKPWFLLINTAVFGLGIPYFILMIVGIIKVLISNIQYSISNKISNIKNKKLFHVSCFMLCIIILWVLGLFFYQSFQFVKSMRYTIYLYPFFAILSGVGIQYINSKFEYRNSKQIRMIKIQNSFEHLKIYVFRIVSYFGFRASSLIIVVLLLVWPLMFSSIYFHKHSRVEASEWIYKNLPANSLILSEHWDDGLPLFVENNYGKFFRFEQLPVFDPDTPEKWQKMNELLNKADYYIPSSNRGWGSIPTMPERYPQMGKFYEDLFLNKTNYKLVKEFTSYPKLQVTSYELQVDDQWSEELFTVYDHPKVMIFKREK